MVGADHPDCGTQFHLRPFSCCRLMLPPLSTQTTLDPDGALISALSTAATDAAAAPSTTSLQCDIIQMTASKMSESGRATISSTNCLTASKVCSPTRFTFNPSMMQSTLSSVTSSPFSTL